MRICEFCERPTPTASLMCERCYCGPGTTGSWRDSPTHPVKGWGVAAAIGVVMATLALLAADLLPPLIGPGMAEDANTRDVAYWMLLLLNLAAMALILMAGLLVIAWMWLVVRNQRYFPRPIQNLGSGWAVGGWFVPFANLVMPFRVMSQIVREELNGRWAAWAVVGWWTCWLGVQGLTALVWQGLGVSAAPAAADSWEKHREFFTSRMGTGLVAAILVAAAGYLLTVLIIGVSLGHTQRIQSAQARRAVISG
jgi:hypothetical protein